MLELALTCFAIAAAAWAVLLHRFHVSLAAIDPELARRAGKPSLFFTAFNGHTTLIGLIGRRDLERSRHASLAPQARRLRGVAWVMIACLVWIGVASLAAFGAG